MPIDNDQYFFLEFIKTNKDKVNIKKFTNLGGPKIRSYGATVGSDVGAYLDLDTF